MAIRRPSRTSLEAGVLPTIGLAMWSRLPSNKYIFFYIFPQSAVGGISVIAWMEYGNMAASGGVGNAFSVKAQVNII